LGSGAVCDRIDHVGRSRKPAIRSSSSSTSRARHGGCGREPRRQDRAASVDHQKAPADAVRPQLRAPRSRSACARVGRTRRRYRPHSGEPPVRRQAIGRAAVASQATARSSAARGRSGRCRQHDLRVLRRHTACHRRKCQRDAGLGTSTASRDQDGAAKICMSRLPDRSAGASAGAADRRRSGDTGAAGAGTDQQILRPQAALSAVADLCSQWCRASALDARGLGWRRLLVAGSPARAARQKRLRLAPSFCR